MKHLKKFEGRFKWNDADAEKNEKIHEYISECIVEFQDKHKLRIMNDDNESTILIALPGVSMDTSIILTSDIKTLMMENKRLGDFLTEVDYLIEKVCTDDEIDHTVQLTQNHLQLVFSWENESPF